MKAPETEDGSNTAYNRQPDEVGRKAMKRNPDLGTYSGQNRWLDFAAD